MKLKLTRSGYEDFTGHLGRIEFQDGVSVEDVGARDSDRLVACGFSVVNSETDEELGVAARLVSDMQMRQPVIEPLDRQTKEEKAEEDRIVLLRLNKAPTDKFYEAEELDAVADKSGIKGLREIAELWKIKSRSIPEMIGLIMGAQNAFLKMQEEKEASVPKVVLEGAADFSSKEEVESKVEDDQGELKLETADDAADAAKAAESEEDKSE
ncbi:MAG: hypothetical protein ACEQSB_00285 [Undibacterium sp.]